MNRPKLAIVTTLVLGAFAGSAQAQEGLPITISGFGTGALTMTNNDKAEFTRINQAAGAAKDPRTGVDSIFGIQATAKLNDTVSFTAQGLARKKSDEDTYGAELAWAFAKIKVNDDFNIRLGRIGMPVYMISDVRNVGYANTMLRPPNEMYRQVPFDSADGGDVTYQHAFGDNTVTAQVAFGNSRVDLASGARLDIKKTVAAQVLLERGPFTYRLSHARSEVNVYDSADLTTLLRTLNALRFTGVASEMALTDVKARFTSAGVAMDYNNVIGMAEYGKRKADSRIVQDTSSWYVMLGYRWGKFTPYYMHGDVKQDSVRSYANLPATGPLAGLTAGVNSAIRTGLQSTNAVGVRWDFYKSTALKVQFDRIKPREGNGYFDNVKPGFNGATVNVYAAAIDFVF